MPDYVLKLTRGLDDSRCTAIAISPSLILTMDHCATHGERYRWVTIYGQSGIADVVFRWPDQDLALLRVGRNEHITISRFPEFRRPNPDKRGYAYGGCPLYFDVTPRILEYKARGEATALGSRDRVLGDHWRVVRNQRYQASLACGGDSGGPIIQDGAVVGLMHAVSTDFYFFAVGREVISIRELNKAFAHWICGAGKPCPIR